MSALLLPAAVLVTVAATGWWGGVAHSSAPKPSARRSAIALAKHQFRPVLGYRKYVAHYGTGWGTVEPRLIDNSGDAVGYAHDLKWTRWGHKVARAQGLAIAYKPHGGTYRHPVRIELRASDLGLCHGKRTYQRLHFRRAHKPGAQLDKQWSSWGDNGHGNICLTDFPPGSEA